MTASMIENLKEKTGKTPEQWVQIVRATRLGKHKAVVDHVKVEYLIGHAGLKGETAIAAWKTAESLRRTTAAAALRLHHAPIAMEFAVPPP